MRGFNLYWELVCMRLRAQTAYQKSFCFEIIGRFLQLSGHIACIWFVFDHVKVLAGWSMWEVLYLYGVTTFTFSMAQITAEGFEDLHLYIKSGEFDQMLIKPVSPLIQVAAQSFRIERIGGVIQSLVALGIAIIKTGANASAYGIMLMLISICSMYLIYYSLFLANGAFAFFAHDNSEIFNAFTYGGIEVAKYPLPIYPAWMQALFVYVIPLGLACYVPAAELYGKGSSVDHIISSGALDAASASNMHNANLAIVTPGIYLVPIMAIIFFVVVLFGWRLGLKHYQSTGS